MTDFNKKTSLKFRSFFASSIYSRIFSSSFAKNGFGETRFTKTSVNNFSFSTFASLLKSSMRSSTLTSYCDGIVGIISTFEESIALRISLLSRPPVSTTIESKFSLIRFISSPRLTPVFETLENSGLRSDWLLISEKTSVER